MTFNFLWWTRTA